MEVEVAVDGGAEIGEGPCWDVAGQVLWWVDIPPGTLHRFEPSTGTDRPLAVGRPLGAVAVRRGGGLVLAVGDGFAVLEPEALLPAVPPATPPGGLPELPPAGPPGVRVHLVAPVEAGDAATRMNDGACDRRGRFFAGTMAWERTAGAGSLYRLGPDGAVEQVLCGLTLSNGIDWSPDGRTMYLVDSGHHRVDRFDFDEEHGRLAGRAPLIQVAPVEGMPDGLTVDAEGCLWVALYGRGVVRRFTAAGVALPAFDVAVPASKVTSCAFGDADLGGLYVTSATRGLTAEVRRLEPHAGAVFRARPEVTGRAPSAYAG